MEIRPLRAADIDRLIEELWLPFAREMADLDPYNALADDVRPDVRVYRQSNLDDSDTATFLATDEDMFAGYAVVMADPSPPVFARGRKPRSRKSTSLLTSVAPASRRRSWIERNRGPGPAIASTLRCR